MSKVFLAAGHSSTVAGACAQGANEAQEVINFVNQAAAILSTQDTKGREIVVVPHNLDLVQSINWINANSKDPGHDLCIEVHMNAGGGHGVEVWFYSGVQVSADFANELLVPLVEYTGLPTRGIKGDATNRYGRLGFIRDTAPLAALIELGFIDTSDLQVVREKGGLALAAAVLKACGGAYKAPEAPKPIPVTPVETPKEEPKLPEPVKEEPPVVVEEKGNNMSPKFTLNKEDLLKIGKGALIALVGALGAYLLTLVGALDLGVYTPFVAAGLSIVANAMVKFAQGK